MSSVEADSRAPVGLAVATGAWVVLSSYVGLAMIESGSACGGYEPWGAGAEVVCGGSPFTVALLTFVGVAFVALAALILGWGRSGLSPRRLGASAAALPVLAYAVLRVITLIP